MRCRTLAAGLLAALASVTGHAACDTGLAERMHAKLHPQRPLDHRLAVCQPWRGFRDRFVVVLPLPRPSSLPGFTAFDLDVLVVEQADNGNTERATVMSRLFQPAAMSEDSVRISEIRLDTARYALARNAHAFGLRVGRQGSSRTHPYSSETLSLYVPRGPQLAKVLDRLEITLEQGEWDTSCAGNFEIVRGHLSVASGTSHGHADLRLRQTRSETRSSSQAGQCVTREKPASFSSTTLRYDGEAYQVVSKVASSD